MAISERAGRPADPSILVDVDRLIAAYYETPDPSDPAQRVAFGTSGHRGSSLHGAFNEAHIAATTEAICRYRAAEGTDGPLFIGKDPHALSEPAFETALRGLVAHGVDVRIDADDGYTPTPVISHAILVHNRGRQDHLADGIVVTPSHNPPEDGGFKYNPPPGGRGFKCHPAARRPGRPGLPPPHPGRRERPARGWARGGPPGGARGRA